MYVLEGFVTIQNLLNNDYRVTSPLGELSPKSRTYSIDVGEYKHTDFPNLVLNSFISKDGVDNISVPTTIVSMVLTAVNQLMAYSNTHSLPFDRDNVINTLTLNLSNLVDGFSVGEFITHDSVDLTLPEWFKFRVKDTNENIKIWLNDESFQNQYDNFITAVIPPLEIVDNFFSPDRDEILRQLTSDSLNIFDRIRVAKDDNPETDIISVSIPYHPVGSTLPEVMTTWTVVVYGRYRDIDAIYTNIIQYILANSIHDERDWEYGAFPSLFRKNYFTLVPQWETIAIENQTLANSINSQLIKLNTIQTDVTTNVDHYSDSHILDNLEILPIPYRYLMIGVVPGTTNDVEHESLSKLFPDYIPVNNLNNDFNRMGLDTQEFALFLNSLIIKADNLYDLPDLPDNMFRVEKEGKVYITSKFKDVTYFVLVRSE